MTHCRRRNRRPSVGITSVQSWDASIHVGRKVVRKPQTAPPPPPLRTNNVYYDDAVPVHTAAGPAVEAEDYLEPVTQSGDLPPPYTDSYFYDDAGNTADFPPVDIDSCYYDDARPAVETATEVAVEDVDYLEPVSPAADV